MSRVRAQATIASVAPGGSGVAHLDVDGERRAVFVPNTAPGDVIHAEIDFGTRPARARVLELVTPGPDRVHPACRWSVTCGGCDWMHLTTQAQARLHSDHVRAALPPAWRSMPVTSVPAPEALAYRVRARVHVRCHRGRVVVGMHGAGSHEPVAVDGCAILQPRLERSRAELSSLFQGCEGRGDVGLSLGATGRAVLDIHWKGDVANQLFAALETAVSSSLLGGARLLLDGATRPAVWGDPTPWTIGGDGAPLRLAPGGFSQASEAVNVALAEHLAGIVSERPVERAVELHAGSGNLSVVLARHVAKLVTVESERDACDAARANLRERGLTAKVVEADADAYAWSAGTQLVVLDPPRTGARPVTERLARSPVARVVYVSCDPQTLGRDLADLAGAYEPASVTTFEMFPQTSHVETVVALRRIRRPSS